MTGHGIGIKIGMVTKDGVKMFGLVQLLMALTGTMMIGRGMGQIGVPGIHDWSWSNWDDSQAIVAGSTQGAVSSNSSTITSAATKPTEIAAAVLTEASHVRFEDLEDISTSASSTGHARHSRPGLASKLLIGAVLIGTRSSSVPDSPAIEKDSLSITSDESIDSEQPKTHRITEFHLQSGIVDKSWVLFDSGASASCCPPRFAEDYPLLSVGSDCPALRSIPGMTLQVRGRSVVELDCDGHSMCVQFYVCVTTFHFHL